MVLLHYLGSKNAVIDSGTSSGENYHTTDHNAPKRAKLHFDRISFGYGNRPFITNLALNIGCCELVVISGPNGSGKTTLLYIAAGLQKPTDGIVEINGRDISTVDRVELARLISLMPQYLPYTPWLSVREIVELGRYAHRSRSNKLRFPVDVFGSKNLYGQEIVQNAMSRMGILHLSDRLSGELSGGELRRVHIARVLVQDSQIILFDEPTSDLDLQHIGALVTLIGELKNEGKTVIVVTHDLNFASVLDGRLILMKDGSIIADDAPCKLMNNETLSKLYQGGFRVERLSNGASAVIPSRIPTGDNGKTGNIGGGLYE